RFQGAEHPGGVAAPCRLVLVQGEAHHLDEADPPVKASAGPGEGLREHQTGNMREHERGDPCGSPHRKNVRRRPTLPPRTKEAVPSALGGLTTGFGMRPGVSLPLWPPKL